MRIKELRAPSIENQMIDLKWSERELGEILLVQSIDVESPHVGFLDDIKKEFSIDDLCKAIEGEEIEDISISGDNLSVHGELFSLEDVKKMREDIIAILNDSKRLYDLIDYYSKKDSSGVTVDELKLEIAERRALVQRLS